MLDQNGKSGAYFETIQNSDRILRRISVRKSSVCKSSSKTGEIHHDSQLADFTKFHE